MAKLARSAEMVAERLDGKLVTVFGGGGFVGRYLAQALLSAGARLRIASRHPERGFRLRPLGNLGQTQFVRADLRDAASIERAVAGSDAVVNLVGIFAGELRAVHGEAPGLIGAAAKQAGTGAYIHVSAIGAEAESPSAYGRSKAAGEAAARAAFSKVTILRPSILFGVDDQFVNRFAGMIAGLPVVPVIGGDAQFQPAHVEDAAHAIVAALADPASHGGKLFELGGPEVISMLGLQQRIAAAQGSKASLMPIPDFIAGPMIKATGWLPGAPVTADQWAMLQLPNVVAEGARGFAALGIEPAPLGLFLDRWMIRYRSHGRFGKKAASSR